MKAFRSVISYWTSLAFVLALMFVFCAPFLKMGVSGMMNIYTDMADAVASGNGAEFSDGLLTQMDNGSQTMLNGLWNWAQNTVEQVGAGEFLDGAIDYVEGWIK